MAIITKLPLFFIDGSLLLSSGNDCSLKLADASSGTVRLSYSVPSIIKYDVNIRNVLIILD